MEVWDLIYPKKCLGCGKTGKYFCDECLKKISLVKRDICPECNRASIGGEVHLGCRQKYSLDGLMSVFSYQGLVRLGVTNLKYRFLKDMESELGGLVIKSFKQRLKTERVWGFRSFLKQKPVIVPIPLYWRRENWRGFNQAKVVAQMLTEVIGLEMREDLIRRKKATKPQAGLKKEERQENVKRAFEARDLVKERAVLLIDDVWTTGETMRQAGRELKKGGVEKVWGFSLAR